MKPGVEILRDAGRAAILLCTVAASTLTSSAIAQSDDVRAARVPAIELERKVGHLSIDVVDLSPRFLDFEKAAVGSSPDERFAIWKKRYGFAAVPPTPEGDAMARKLLDEAWPRYAQNLARLAEGAAAMRPDPVPLIGRVAMLLGLDQPARMKLIAYVGMFENNAFTSFEEGGVPTLALPVESPPDRAMLLSAHEGTHAVHILTAKLSAGYERSIARIVFEEGLAMHASRALLPGHPEPYYTEAEPGWHASTQARIIPILGGIEPSLESKAIPDILRFTFGKGSQGFQREAYAAGWAIIGQLLRDGYSLAELARIPEEKIPETVRRAMVELHSKHH